MEEQSTGEERGRTVNWKGTWKNSQLERIVEEQSTGKEHGRTVNWRGTWKNSHE